MTDRIASIVWHLRGSNKRGVNASRAETRSLIASSLIATKNASGRTSFGI